jgi:membrane-associated phospholipid phosphatase
VLIPLVALLSLATVYGMFHYGVDVLAGMAMAGGAILLYRSRP